MAKIILALVIMAVVASQSAGRRATRELSEAENDQKIEACMNETGATFDDLDDFFFTDSPALNETVQQCFVGCLYEQYGALRAGAVSPEGFDEYISGIAPEIAEQAASCVEQTAELGDDRCVTGPALHKCIASFFEKIE